MCGDYDSFVLGRENISKNLPIKSSQIPLYRRVFSRNWNRFDFRRVKHRYVSVINTVFSNLARINLISYAILF